MPAESDFTVTDGDRKGQMTGAEHHFSNLQADNTFFGNAQIAQMLKLLRIISGFDFYEGKTHLERYRLDPFFITLNLNLN